MLGLAGSLLGSVSSGIMGMLGADDANDMTKKMAQKRYQWQTADMTKAGLNPAMMYGGGGNAPPGVPQVRNEMEAPAAAIKDAASSATQTMVANKTIENLTSQIAKQNAEKANIAAALPGISADSGRKFMEYGDIKKIPDAVRIPIVQSGYGADKLASAGRIPAIGAGALASAKSAGAGASDGLRQVGGLSGPAVASAKAVARALKEKYDSMPSYSEAEREAARRRNAERWKWWTGKSARGSVQYQQ